MTHSMRLASTAVRSSVYMNRAFKIQNIRLQNFLRDSLCSFSTQKSAVQETDPHLPDYLQRYACQSAVSVFSYVKQHEISYHSAVRLLKALRVQTLLKKSNPRTIMRDKHFDLLCQTFVSHCDQLTPALLVSGLRSLLEIGISPKSAYVEIVGKVILRKIHSFSVTQLIGCLHLHRKYLCTDLQKQVVAQLLKRLEHRYIDISKPAEVIMLIQLIYLFEKQLLRKIESKMIEVMNLMDINGLVRIICTISEMAVRNRTLLDSVSLQLRQKHKKPSIRETLNVLHALNSLSFYDTDLLLYLTENRESDIAAVDQPSVISALLTVCGHLKWRHEGILNACTQWINDHFEACGPREFVSLILTAAALNYTPQNASVFQRIFSSLTFEKVGEKDVWLDVVWSLAVLNYVDKGMLLNVLSPSFHQSLLDESGSGSITNNLKLMNLKYVLKRLYPECVFSCDLFLQPIQLQCSKECEACHKDVLNALNNLVPMDEFMCTDICTDMGVSIDAEFIMGKKGKPFSISKYGLKAKPTIVTKPLPKNAKRIALKIWLFRDYTLNEKYLTGVNDLAVKLLTAQGYVVVQVPYDDFSKQRTSVKKVVYLSQLIKDSMTEPKKLDDK